MTVTINIYQQAALQQLASYGFNRPAAAPTPKEGPIFALLCSTDISQFSATYSGRLNTLLDTAIVELPTENGYKKGGQPIPCVSTAPNGNTIITLGRGSKSLYFRPASRLFPITYATSPVTLTYSDCFKWTAVGGTLSAKSLLLCLQTPLSPTISSDPVYSASYPLAMIDFGGTVSVPAGSVLAVPYPITQNVIQWTVD